MLEEKEQTTVGLKLEQEEVIEKCRVVKQEKDNLQIKFKEDKVQIWKEKEQQLTNKVRVKEATNRELHYVTGLEHIEEYPMEIQVAKLVAAIQKLQQRVAELELQEVPSTPQEVQYQREEIAWSAVHRIKALALECKQISSRSAQNYERLTKDLQLKTLDLELKTLDSHLQEEKQQATTLQAQLKPLLAVERMKISQEQHMA